MSSHAIHLWLMSTITAAFTSTSDKLFRHGMLGNTKALPFNPMHLGIWAAEFPQVCTGQLKVRSQRSDWDIAKTHCICGALAAANTSLVVIRRREPAGEEGAVYGIACKHWVRGDIGKGSIYRNNMKQQHQLQGVPIAWSWVNIRDCTWSDAHCGEANALGCLGNRVKWKKLAISKDQACTTCCSSEILLCILSTNVSWI